jgi:alkylation response protein AidB-like acyl-CoA dehydrogenase
MVATRDLNHGIDELAARWRQDRPARQVRRHLDPDDFRQLGDAGLWRSVAPIEQGGRWEGVQASTRPIAEALRALAAADPSVALVAAMHPAVVGYWLTTEASSQPDWVEQRRAVLASAAAGRQWGTITSEPGSGGDVLRTRTVAEPTGDRHPDIPGACYLLTGDKHFGSGFGVSDFMFTTARAVDDDQPSAFFIDMRDVRDGHAPTLQVTAEWDGAGMVATQSHGARLERQPAVQLAYRGPIEDLMMNAGPFVMVLFTAVILGVLDEAMSTARAQLGPKRDGMRAFEQVEWSRADLEHWLSIQAFEGALRAIEGGDHYQALRAALRAKTATAELVEGCLRRVGQVMGGGTFSRRSPLAWWFEDVRALGFLRPPWGLAFDNLFATAFD